MANLLLKDLFDQFQEHFSDEQDLREQIRGIVKDIDKYVKEAAIALQIIHSDIAEVSNACLKARQNFELCKDGYSNLAKIIPIGQYYRYCDHWYYLTQRVVFLIALTIYLEAGFLVTRETVADILGLKISSADGFHLDIEDFLMGLLQCASELSRFAINAVTLGDYERPLNISRFVSDLSAGFRLLNLKNDGLRKRFDALKYDVKKIEEVVYDISIRGLRSTPLAQVTADAETTPVEPESEETA